MSTTIPEALDNLRTKIAAAYSACEEKGAELPATKDASNLAQTIQAIPASENTSFLYKKESDTEWQEYVPTTNDIQIVNEKVTITATDFKQMDGFANVREVMLPNKWKNGSEVIDVTAIGNAAFAECSGLTYVTIPNSVKSIGVYAFVSCFGLINMSIPDGVTSIMDFAFDNCTNLMSMTIPDSVVSIGRCVFNGCSNLMSMTIHDGVTSIESGTFMNCSRLASMTIPSSVVSIMNNVFQYCTGLIYVVIPTKTMAQVQAMNYSSWSLRSGCKICCSDGIITIE